MKPDSVVRGAVMSEDGRYRYLLTRTWDVTAPLLRVIMLNPSTADHEKDDATIKRLMQRARNLNLGGLVVTNLFAYRATNPDVLAYEWAKLRNVVGSENDYHILRFAKFDGVVIAWGCDFMVPRRERPVLELLQGVEVKCFGVTKSGFPLHPLHLSYEVPLVPYTGRFAR